MISPAKIRWTAVHVTSPLVLMNDSLHFAEFLNFESLTNLNPLQNMRGEIFRHHVKFCLQKIHWTMINVAKPLALMNDFIIF